MTSSSPWPWPMPAGYASLPWDAFLRSSASIARTGRPADRLTSVSPVYEGPKIAAPSGEAPSFWGGLGKGAVAFETNEGRAREDLNADRDWYDTVIRSLLLPHRGPWRY